MTFLYTGIDPLAMANITVTISCRMCGLEIGPIDGLPHANHVRDLIKDHLSYIHDIGSEVEETL